MKSERSYFRIIAFIISAVFVFSGCVSKKSNIEETTEIQTNSTEETTEQFVLSEQVLKSVSLTVEDIEEKISFENLAVNNDSVQLTVNEYNTQDSDLFTVKMYFEKKGDNDYSYVSSDSDGFTMYQTSYFNYTNRYGEELCVKENLPSAEEIYSQCDSFYNCSDEITEVKGEFEKDGKNYIVCEIDPESFSNLLPYWGNIDKNVSAVFNFDGNNVGSLAIFKEDSKILDADFVFNKCDEDVENIEDDANEYFKVHNEEDSKDETYLLKDEE